MNYISIREPRWHDRTILIAAWKIGKVNEVTINHHEFPTPYYITSDEIRKCPITIVTTTRGNKARMYAVPVSELSTDLVLESL